MYHGMMVQTEKVLWYVVEFLHSPSMYSLLRGKKGVWVGVWTHICICMVLEEVRGQCLMSFLRCCCVCSDSVSLGLELSLNFGYHPQFIISMWQTLLPELAPESLKCILLKHLPSFRTWGRESSVQFLIIVEQEGLLLFPILHLHLSALGTTSKLNPFCQKILHS